MRRVVLLLLLVWQGAFAATLPYDENADAKAQIQAALAQSSIDRVKVIVVFGANWCGDCRVLDTAFKTGATAPLMERHFHVVKVNVGRYDRNIDLAEGYGVPLKQGIPAVVVLAGDGRPVYVTRSGELADARSMGEAGIYDFFTRVVAAHARP